MVECDALRPPFGVKIDGQHSAAIIDGLGPLLVLAIMCPKIAIGRGLVRRGIIAVQRGVPVGDELFEADHAAFQRQLAPIIVGEPFREPIPRSRVWGFVSAEFARVPAMKILVGQVEGHIL